MSPELTQPVKADPIYRAIRLFGKPPPFLYICPKLIDPDQLRDRLLQVHRCEPVTDLRDRDVGNDAGRGHQGSTEDYTRLTSA